MIYSIILTILLVLTVIYFKSVRKTNRAEYEAVSKRIAELDATIDGELFKVENLTFDFWAGRRTVETSRQSNIQKLLEENDKLQTKLKKLEDYLEIQYIQRETKSEGYEKRTENNFYFKHLLNSVAGNGGGDSVKPQGSKKKKSKKK